MTSRTPTTQAEYEAALERSYHDPDVCDAIERLFDAFDRLKEALHDQVNETALLLRGAISLERVVSARGQLEAAERDWAAALASADELLVAKGGEA